MTENSPLKEPKVEESIAQLFDLDPLEITDEQLERMKVAIRSAREKWAQADMEAKSRGKRVLPSDGLKLEDLGI